MSFVWRLDRFIHSFSVLKRLSGIGVPLSKSRESEFPPTKDKGDVHNYSTGVMGVKRFLFAISRQLKVGNRSSLLQKARTINRVCKVFGIQRPKAFYVLLGRGVYTDF